MATTANPLAIRIGANLDDFKKNMLEMKAQLETTKAAMAQMSNAFDGSSVVARANAAVKAVADLGGMTKLTAAEQARYNAIIQQGMDIYAARGRVAPAALAAEAAAAKQATATASEFSSVLGNVPGLLMGIAGSLGIAFSVGGIVSAIKSTMQWGEDLENTATALDMNVGQLQRLEFAWNTTGASAEKGIGAIQMMLQRIGAGTADAAIQRLGFSVYAIEQMSPADMFLTLTGALSQVTSETDRAALGAQVFGKGWKTIAVSVANDMAKVAEQAPALADAQVRELARAQQAWERLSMSVKVYFGLLVAGAYAYDNRKDLENKAAAGGRGTERPWWLTPALSPADMPKLPAAPNQGFLSIQEMSAFFDTANATDMDALNASTKRLAESLPDVIRKAKEQAEAMAALKAATVNLTDQQKWEIQVGLLYADNLGLIAKAYGINEAAAKKWVDGMKAAEDLQAWFAKDSEATAQRVAKENHSLTDEGLKTTLAMADQRVHAATAANDRLYESAKEFSDRTAALTMSGTQLAIQQSKIQEERELARIAAVKDADVAAKQEAMAAVVQYFTTEQDLIKRSHDDWITFFGQLESVVSSFTGNLSGVGRTLSGILGAVKSGMAANAQLSRAQQEQSAAQMALNTASTLEDAIKSSDRLKAANASVAQSYVLMAAQAVAALSQITAETSSFQDAMAGFQAGYEIGGPIGGAIGAFGGFLAGEMIHTDARMQAQKDAAANQQLKDYRDQLLLTYGTAMNLDVLARAIGSDLSDAFTNAKGQTGLIWYNAALKDFEATQKALVKSLQTGTGLAGAQARALMDAYQAATATDQEQQQAADYSKTSLTTAAAGLTALLAGLQTSADAAAQKTYVDMQLAAGSTLAAAQAVAKDLTGVFLTTQAQADGLGASIVATFGEMLVKGVSFAEALKAIQQPLTVLRSELDQTGIRGGAAFDYLSKMSTIANDAIMGPLAAAIQGSKDSLVGLSNSRLLTQEMFTGISASATQAYQGIVTHGGDATAALGIMQPELQAIWQLQKFYGFQVDKTTQALLDQAVAGKLVGDGAMTDAQKQVAALQSIADKMGELVEYFEKVFPAAVNVGFTSIGDAATGLQNRLDTYRGYSTPPPAPGPSHTAQFANGTDGFEWFGSGTPAILHGWEAVVPLSRSQGGGGGSSSSSGGSARGAVAPAPVTNIFNFDIKALDRAGVRDDLVKVVIPALGEVLRRGGQPRTEMLEGLGLQR